MRSLIVALAALGICTRIASAAAVDTPRPVDGILAAISGTGSPLTAFAAPVQTPEVEKPSAINGSAYTVVSPLFDGSSGSSSYVRLYNGGGATSTFNILVVNAANGITMGAAAIQVPKNASPQYPLTGANSIFSLAGVAPSANGSYALYILNSEYASAYQHVTFNGASGLFENQSVCTSTINQKLSPSNQQVLTNVHTTALASGNYPSVINLHNYSANPVAVKLTAYDAVTGASIGNTTQTITANSTTSLTESQLETLLNFRPTSAQLHINVVVTNTNNSTVPIGVTQSIRNVPLGGEVNMASACAINPTAALVVTTPAPSNVPVAYCGTTRLPASAPYPYSAITYSVLASVSPGGQLVGIMAGANISTNTIDAAAVAGTVTGTSFVITTGGVGSGTIRDGTLSATFNGSYGAFPITLTNAQCGP